jgi:hypothetical protein
MDTRELGLCMMSDSGFHGYHVSMVVIRADFCITSQSDFFDCHETKLQSYLTKPHHMAAHPWFYNTAQFVRNIKDCTVGLLSLQCFNGTLACEYNGRPLCDRHMVSHILYIITNTKMI